MRTLPVFFGVLELLPTAGVTTVAEAAFQDRIWRPRLAPLLPLARLRIVHCTADPRGGLPADRAARIEVNTTSGYRPGIDQVVAFINGR